MQIYLISPCAETGSCGILSAWVPLLDMHPIYFHGQTLISQNHRKDTITSSLPPRDAFMVAKGVGEWLLDCRVHGRDLFLLHNTGSGGLSGL